MAAQLFVGSRRFVNDDHCSYPGVHLYKNRYYYAGLCRYYGIYIDSIHIQSRDQGNAGGDSDGRWCRRFFHYGCQ
ncbi:hypothetical protein D3C87_1863830 [compost metagenome]